MALGLEKTNSFGDERNYHKIGYATIDFHNNSAVLKPHSYPDEAKRREGVSFQKILESVEFSGEDWATYIEPAIEALGASLYSAWKAKAKDLEGATDLI